MSRQKFLGNIDISVNASLLTSRNVPTEIPNSVTLNKIKKQDDLIVIEVGTLLTPDECDNILNNIHEETFEHMPVKYDSTKRNNSRLIVMDNRLARILWRRLEFNNKLTELISNPQPLGFNVQGKWEMSGVNTAMRINRYDEGEYFSPHKDGQYAPNGDERSLLSLIIYLTDNYEKGETKFYFPKNIPKSDIKGLTIKEEIKTYGGLEHGFECVMIKPKKGYAVLFTHNLLHEATAPELTDQIATTKRYVLRTDVLVKRKEKLLGFAVSPEEEEDYFACLNLFREAQQNELREYTTPKTLTTTINTGELYERSLSIRYCYPRLLESNVKEEKYNSICDKLPAEIWLNIFKFLHEQDVENLIFAYSYLISLKLIWAAQETKLCEINPFRSKFIPTIEQQYGSQTLFRFSDADFFYQNIHGCCRVAAVYTFFLLGHTKDSTTYTVRYNRNTHEVCEVEMEKLLSDIFYNRNCYGSLYKVKQANENVRIPMVDLDYSVDRTYMTNRHQSQFIGQDLSSRFHFTKKPSDNSDSDLDSYKDNQHLNKTDLFARPRTTDFLRSHHTIVDGYVDLSFRKNLMKQTEQDSGTSLCRMLSAKNLHIPGPCYAHSQCDDDTVQEVDNLIQIYNHLIFDFDTHQLTVEHIPKKMSYVNHHSFPYKRRKTAHSSAEQKNPTRYYRVNVEKLAKETKGFNHASCASYYPDMIVDQFSFLDYTYLSHVYLDITQATDHVSVVATYGGIAAL